MEEEFRAYISQVEEAVSFLRERLVARPEIFIVLGTGLSDIVPEMEQPLIISYADIPHFPLSTVEGHAGQLIAGRLAGRSVVVLQGRFHYYEGYSTRRATFPVRVMALLGAQIMIAVNAAGGLNPSFAPGTLMVVSDHINLMPENPLRGPNNDAWGPRFVDLSKAYDQDLLEVFLRVAKKNGVGEITSGIYCSVPGPSLETPAETRFLRAGGADAVGMSTVPEVIVARHAALRVLAVSVIANVNDPDDFQPIFLDDVIVNAKNASGNLALVIKEVLKEM